MKTVLILGGTRFFGKKLVDLLIREGFDVSVATRGNAKVEFCGPVRRFTVERNDSATLKNAAWSDDWDVVYDQVCFSPETASLACDLFSGRVKQYVFTSSQVVYDVSEHAAKEEDFDPLTYATSPTDASFLSYSEGKRMAEAVFLQRRAMPVVSVRFSMVLGVEDHAKRMNFHVRCVHDGLPIYIPSPDAPLSFISSDEAACFLFWLSKTRCEGPLNACSSGRMSLRELLEIIEKNTSKRALITRNEEGGSISPYALKNGPWHMDTSRAAELGFAFSELSEWIDDVVSSTIRLEGL